VLDQLKETEEETQQAISGQEEELQEKINAVKKEKE
jgi:hypothetical protein